MTIRKGCALLAAVAALAVLDRSTALAQFASAIEGTVSDSSGALVPGATVAITNEETGVSQSTTTSSAGTR